MKWEEPGEKSKSPANSKPAKKTKSTKSSQAVETNKTEFKSKSYPPEFNSWDEIPLSIKDDDYGIGPWVCRGCFGWFRVWSSLYYHKLECEQYINLDEKDILE